MRTAQLLRVGEPEIDQPAPRLFQPAENAAARDFATLFNLRRNPGYYNADAKAALLRRVKATPHDELFVDFSRDDVIVALKAGGVDLAAGDWNWQATVGGHSLTSQGRWTEVCWYRDGDCDYLEIELDLSRGWRLERQMLLAREDRFLFLADALLGPELPAVELHYAHSLPIAPRVTFAKACETREGWLESGSRQRAGVVSPALAEWRSEFCHAEMTQADDRLTLKQAALGRNLFAPLWIDLDPRRLKRPFTWRRLTVAENLAIVPRDIAAAYRIQAGRQQWLIYRSLAPIGNRSVPGHNTIYSFVCSRILSMGETEAIVEIE